MALCTLWTKFACGQVSSPRLHRYSIYFSLDIRVFCYFRSSNMIKIEIKLQFEYLLTTQKKIWVPSLNLWPKSNFIIIVTMTTLGCYASNKELTIAILRLPNFTQNYYYMHEKSSSFLAFS